MTPEQFSFGHEAMNAPYEITISGHKEEYARSAAETVFNKIDWLEERLSKFIDYSDITRISVVKPGEPVVVSPETMECLLMSLWAHEETAGAFDITVGKGIGNLVLDSEHLTASVLCELTLDLGGIGKGYALDVGADILGDWEIENALLTAGPSTILALGTEGEEPWSIGLHGNPLDLRDMALSASGKDVLGEHIINPRNGEKADAHQKAWVVCPSAAIADALSTAFMVMSTDEVRQFCSDHDDITAYLMKNNGEYFAVGS